MDKFTRKPITYQPFGGHFMSFIIFKGQAYPSYVRVTLSDKGKKRLGLEYATIHRVYITEHFFTGIEENIELCCHVTSIKHANTYHATITPNDDYIEEVHAQPIEGDPQEYIDYVKNYVEHYYDDKPTAEEEQLILDTVQAGIPPKYALPQRLEGKINLDHIDPDKPAKPLFKDWEIPELVAGWIAFIVFFFGVFVFKDWYVQLILRVVGSCLFGWWRQMKVFGFK